MMSGDGRPLEGLTNDELNPDSCASVIEFDAEGNVVNSWRFNLFQRISTAARSTARACVAGWIRDGIVQEYSHEGRELLLQIGKRGVSIPRTAPSPARP